MPEMWEAAEIFAGVKPEDKDTDGWGAEDAKGTSQL